MLPNNRLALVLAVLIIAGWCASAHRRGTAGTRAAAASGPPHTAGRAVAGRTRRQRAVRLSCDRVSVAAVGDLMLGTDFPEPRLPGDDGRLQLRDAAPLLERRGYRLRQRRGRADGRRRTGQAMQGPIGLLPVSLAGAFCRTLAAAGFTVMSLANNHARDFGEAGRSASMAALAAAGIRHSGRIGDIASWNIGEVRAAMIAFSPFSGSWPMLDLDVAELAVRELAADHDLVIVSFHGGAEGADAEHIPFTTERYYGEDRGDSVKFSRRMIDAGADLVIGHGPHVPRAMELYRDRLIAYSLGNFAT